jgi:hypothetical protein
MAGTLLFIVLVGFTPTLYLRPYFDVPAMPMYVLVHGGVLTTWFVWFVVQASMVSADRIDVHRRLGIIGVVIGVAVVAAGLMAALGLIPRLSALGRDIEANLTRNTMTVWANVGLLVPFGIFLSLAVRFRRRADFHKRLMLLASISIVGPALGRWAVFPAMQLSEVRMVNEVIYGFGVLLALLLALVFYDVITTKRIHPVTTWGAPSFLLCLALFSFVVPNAEFARSFILWLA